MQKFSIAKDDMYNAWPDVAMTESGELLCVYTQCEHHLDRKNSSLMLVRSHDKGKTWSKGTRIGAVSTDGTDCWNNARIQKLKDGNMIILCDKLLSFSGDMSKAQTFLWRGGKNGECWGEPKPLDIFGIVPDRILEMSNGEMITAAHYPDENGVLTQYGYISSDQGKSWIKVTIASDARYQLCEASILEAGEGVLIALMRENSGRGDDCKKAISRDYGRTWDGVYDMPLSGCHRPVAGWLSDGVAMISYRYMQGGRPGFGSTQQNAFLAFTTKADLLETERNKQTVRIFPLDYDRNPKADIGYTGWVQTGKDEVYVVNYLLDDWHKAQIRGYSIKKSDVIL